MNILLVEDEAKVAEFLNKCLKELRPNVDLPTTGSLVGKVKNLINLLLFYLACLN
jgi:DNA-binding response OmpR family regulator